MESNDFYYLLMVCAAFALFAVVLATSSIKYRAWLRHRPTQAADD
jgi:hypothetical protein